MQRQVNLQASFGIGEVECDCVPMCMAVHHAYTGDDIYTRYGVRISKEEWNKEIELLRKTDTSL